MDDPVEVYCDLVGVGFNPRDMDEAHQKIIRALAAHYRREGMREAAGLCDTMDLDGYPDRKPFGHDFAQAILRAAEEVKP